MKSDEYRIIEVLPHNPEWKEYFNKETILLKSIFGDEAVSIEHIGSTSISNIHAKPIVDILIVCRSIENIDSLNEKMISQNYRPFGEYGMPGRRFFVKSENGKRLVNLHIWQLGHEDIKRHLAFRNYMNKYPDIAQEYSKLKENLAQKFPHDIQGYMNGKNDFIKKHEILSLQEEDSRILKKIPILIIGAGPVGLSMALALARQNVHSLVIERHSGRTEHPRARGVSMRTMELFKQWGNIDELLKYEFPREAIRFIWSESLQGNEVTRVQMKGLESYTHGPIGASFVTQDCVEEYLHNTLKRHPEAEVQFLKEMISFEEIDTGVLVRLLNRKTNEEELIHAQYVVAADGAHSPTRKQLKIEMEGLDNLGRSCSVYCEFDISKWTNHRPAAGFFFTDPKLLGRALFTAYGKNRWIVGMNFTPQNKKEDFTDEYCISEIRRVCNIPNLDIKIINKSFWTMAAQIAMQYRHGRILLVGDAAHRLPPTGGLGMNTGIADAHNLAWKLAFVLNNAVSDTLLDTYHEERAPIAKRNIEWSTENAKRFFDIYKAIHAGDHETLKIKLHDQQKNLNYEGLDLGFIYHSNAVISENNQTISIQPDKYEPTTLPGSRAPYMHLIQNGHKISTLDLFEKEFVLLIGKEGKNWVNAAQKIDHLKLIPFKFYRIAADADLIDPENVFHNLYEISEQGCVLIRPDGHVAWRSQGESELSEKTLKNVFEKLMLKINKFQRGRTD